MDPNRRHWLVAALVSFFSFAWWKRSSAADDPRWQLAEERVNEAMDAIAHGRKPAWPPEYSKDEVLLIAMGGSIPDQRKTSIVRGITLDNEFQAEMARHKAAWFTSAQTPAELATCGYPRVSAFCVNAEIIVGTIDEIVEDFKQKLIKAREACNAGGPLVAEAIGYNPENQAKLRALRDQYRGDKPAATLPWDHEGSVARTIQAQNTIINTWEAPQVNLPITKAQWVWLVNNNYRGVACMFLAYGVDRVRVAERTATHTTLKWDVVMSGVDSCFAEFDRDDQGLCLILNNPNPWTNPELMSKEAPPA